MRDIYDQVHGPVMLPHSVNDSPRINRCFVALFTYLVVQAGTLLGLFLTSQYLPDRVASHFSGAGAPASWTSRSSYMLSMLGLLVGLSVLMILIFYIIRFFPLSTINVPNREYWLAPEHCQETFDALFCAGIWLAIFQVTFMFGIHLLVVDANNTHPVKLSSHIWLLLIGLVLTILAWGYCLIRRFHHVTDESSLMESASNESASKALNALQPTK
jgi:hypothetical protein